jgi:hypothetical protein
VIFKNLINLLLITLLLTFITIGCKKEQSVIEKPSSVVIGSAGGEVKDEYGASIVVPPKALASDISISVQTLITDSLPSELQSSVVRNVIECLPSGLTFQKPVTITLPITNGKTYSAGDSLNLFFYNKDSMYWQMTDVFAKVTTDGKYLTASVNHFSDYGTNPDGGYGRGDFKGIHNSIHFTVAADVWAHKFMESLGGIGAKKRFSDCCLTLANAIFNFQYISPKYSGKYGNTYGNQTNCDRTEKLNFGEGTQDDGYRVVIDVQLCWVVCDLDLRLTVSQSHFMLPDDEGKTANLTANVTCGDGPGAIFSGQTVKFVITSGPGRIDPPLARTNGSGEATATYTVKNRGISAIRTEVQSCNALESKITTRTANIVVDTLIPDNIYANVIIHHSGEDMPWTFSDRIEMMLIIDIEDDVVSIKGGEGSHKISCKSNDADCSIKNLNAPDFSPTGKIQKIGNTLEVEFNPKLASINFTYHCDFEENSFSAPVPAYGNMISSIIAKYVKGSIQMELGSFIKGSGSESFDEDIPLQYEYEIIYGTRTHP